MSTYIYICIPQASKQAIFQSTAFLLTPDKKIPGSRVTPEALRSLLKGEDLLRGARSICGRRIGTLSEVCQGVEGE